MARRVRVGACLSLSGKYARFGTRVVQALRAWQSMTWPQHELFVEDDESDTRTLAHELPRVAARCDVLLGPYSTQLATTAADVAAEEDLLLWNHGGAGDNVQTGHPGHVVSVLTPASRYGDPYVRRLASTPERAPLWIVHGTGRFSRQVAAGAVRSAERHGVDAVRVDSAADLPAARAQDWDLFTCGSFDDDIRTVNHAKALPFPPRTICAVAAGVSEFRYAVACPDGIFGVAQWVPGNDGTPTVGPRERDFLAAHARMAGSTPDYPAVQAAVSAVLGSRCVDLAGGTTRDLLWPVAAALDTETFYGRYVIDAATGAQVGHDTVLVHWGT